MEAIESVKSSPPVSPTPLDNACNELKKYLKSLALPGYRGERCCLWIPGFTLTNKHFKRRHLSLVEDILVNILENDSPSFVREVAEQIDTRLPRTFDILVLAGLTDLLLQVYALGSAIIEDKLLPIAEDCSLFPGTAEQLRRFYQTQWIFFCQIFSGEMFKETIVSSYLPTLPIEFGKIRPSPGQTRYSRASKLRSIIPFMTSTSPFYSTRLVGRNDLDYPFAAIRMSSSSEIEPIEATIQKSLNKILAFRSHIGILRLIELWDLGPVRVFVNELPNNGTLEDFWLSQQPPDTYEADISLGLSLSRMIGALDLLHDGMDRLDDKGYSLENISAANVLVISIPRESPYCWRFVLSDFQFAKTQARRPSMRYFPPGVSIAWADSRTDDRDDEKDVNALGWILFDCAAWIARGSNLENYLRRTIPRQPLYNDDSRAFLGIAILAILEIKRPFAGSAYLLTSVIPALLSFWPEGASQVWDMICRHFPIVESQWPYNRDVAFPQSIPIRAQEAIRRDWERLTLEMIDTEIDLIPGHPAARPLPEKVKTDIQALFDDIRRNWNVKIEGMQTSITQVMTELRDSGRDH